MSEQSSLLAARKLGVMQEKRQRLHDYFLTLEDYQRAFDKIYARTKFTFRFASEVGELDVIGNYGGEKATPNVNNL